MKTQLVVEVEFDPDITDPEGLASAMDRLLETALSIPDVLEEYGSPEFSPCSVAPPPPTVVLNIHGGALQDVFCSDTAARAILTDWDAEGASPNDPGIVEVVDIFGKRRLASVAEFPVSPFGNLAAADCQGAIEAAGISLDSGPREPTLMVQRYVLYNPDTGELVSRSTYPTYQEAIEDPAAELHDVMIVPITYEEILIGGFPAGEDSAQEAGERKDAPSRLPLDVSLFRRQRELLWNIADLARHQMPYVAALGDAELLEGLINLTDLAADLAQEGRGIEGFVRRSEDR